MPHHDLAPTRPNLAGLKADLALAHEGHELLEQKRQILVLELKQFTARAAEAQRRADTTLAAAFAALRKARIACGEAEVYSAARTVTTPPEITLHERRVMGVSVPGGSYAPSPAALSFGTHTTSVWTDEAALRFQAALTALADLAQTRIAVVRLAHAIQKTIRRVNALEKILIPECQESIQYIQDALEESDRQAIFNLKLIKEHLAQKSCGD